jgi:hypothetical protein
MEIVVNGNSWKGTMNKEQRSIQWFDGIVEGLELRKRTSALSCTPVGYFFKWLSVVMGWYF